MIQIQPTIRDYLSAMESQNSINVAELLGGNPISKNGKLLRFAGGFCVVFPYCVNNKKYAIRCWHSSLSHAKERIKLISEAIEKLNLPYFVHFRYIDNAIYTEQGPQPIVLMDWVDAKPIKDYMKDCLYEPNKLILLADKFLEMVKLLHKNNISHGDLQHGNILVTENGNIVLVDYDSIFVPALRGWNDEIKGLPGYQHPSRAKSKYASEKLDYFSELIIYISIKALAYKPSLWHIAKMDNSETMLFSAKDIDSAGNSFMFSELKNVPSIAPLVDKLIAYTKCQSIEELSPLENVVKSPIDILSEKWRNCTPLPRSKPNCKSQLTHDEIDCISSKW